MSELASPTEKAPVCLRTQGIDKNNGVVNRVRRACGLSDNNGGVGRGQGIHDESEGSETMTEASKMQGQQRRMWR